MKRLALALRRTRARDVAASIDAPRGRANAARRRGAGARGATPGARRAALLRLCAPLAVAALGAAEAAHGESIVLQSTTSTANSGLYDAILPAFTDATGIRVDVVAVGTGQAIRNAENGDGDVLLVHATAAEERFVADGFGVERFDVMYNDFVIVGPSADPAGIGGGEDASAALATIARSGTPFVSRGDDSGTHVKERALWESAGVDVDPASGRWYRETGSGMGATLNVAVGMNAYALTDRATWLAFGNRGAHAILVEGDEALFNQYGVIAVDPARHPHVDAEAAAAFVDWIRGEAGQRAIGEYRLDGEQLFFPNAASE